MTRIVCISDTHCNDLTKLNLPEGDLLIHAGDFTYRGTIAEVSKAMKELGEVAKRYKFGAVFTVGNHDWLFEKDPVLARSLVPNNCIYLNDEETEINGLTIHGSPVQPEFCGWAFNKQRGDEIQKHWDMIRTGVDIVLTHGPAYGILDTTNIGANLQHCGCMNLYKTLLDRVKPRFHICGHLHEGHGIKKIDNTTFVNASLLDDYYNLVYEPIVLEI